MLFFCCQKNANWPSTQQEIYTRNPYKKKKFENFRITETPIPQFSIKVCVQFLYIWNFLHHKRETVINHEIQQTSTCSQFAKILVLHTSDKHEFDEILLYCQEKLGKHVNGFDCCQIYTYYLLIKPGFVSIETEHFGMYIILFQLLLIWLFSKFNILCWRHYLRHFDPDNYRLITTVF